MSAWEAGLDEKEVEVAREIFDQLTGKIVERVDVTSRTTKLIFTDGCFHEWHNALLHRIPIPVTMALPDDCISVLVLYRVEADSFLGGDDSKCSLNWEVAYHEGDKWFRACGAEPLGFPVVKWMHLPAEED